MRFVRAQNFGTIRATPPQGRGILCPEVEPLRVMIAALCSQWHVYDWKAEGRGMRTRAGWTADSQGPGACHLGLARAGCTNKPNWRGSSRQTKPISAAATGWASTRRKRSYGELNMQETSAKQSQFPAMPGGTGPEGRGTWGRICQTNPMWQVGCAPEGEMRETNPISGWRDALHSTIPAFQSDADCAKRSQFPSAGTRRADRGSPPAPLVSRSIVPNKPNSGSGKRRGKCFARKELW